ncbi:hypothetical protein D3C80_1797920 [compost metagenome]
MHLHEGRDRPPTAGLKHMGVEESARAAGEHFNLVSLESKRSVHAKRKRRVFGYEW